MEKFNFAEDLFSKVLKFNVFIITYKKSLPKPRFENFSAVSCYRIFTVLFHTSGFFFELVFVYFVCEYPVISA